MPETKVALQCPPDTLQVEVGVNKYTIKLPNNGQLIDIETAKITMTNGTHKDQMFGTIAAQQAYILTEAIATFQIILPKLNTDLNVKSLLELNPLQSKSFLKAYELYYDWMDKWRKFVNQDVAVDEEKREDDKK